MYLYVDGWLQTEYIYRQTSNLFNDDHKEYSGETKNNKEMS